MLKESVSRLSWRVGGEKVEYKLADMAVTLVWLSLQTKSSVMMTISQISWRLLSTASNTGKLCPGSFGLWVVYHSDRSVEKTCHLLCSPSKWTLSWQGLVYFFSLTIHQAQLLFISPSNVFYVLFPLKHSSFASKTCFYKYRNETYF